MNQFQENSLRRYNVMRNVLNDNSSLWNSNATFALTVADFLNQFDAINALSRQQLNNTKGVTETKLNARIDVIERTMAQASAAKAYAANINDIELLTICSITRTTFLQARSVDVRALAQNIHNAASPVISNLNDYGADANSLLALQNAINLFESLLGVPRAEQAAKVAATKMLTKAFADIRNTKNNRLTPLMAQYKNTHSDFYNKYVSSCAIANLGHRHKVLFKGGVYDANKNPIRYAELILTGPKKRKKITDADGLYKFTQLTPGVYTFKIKLNTGEEQSKTFEITTPQVVEVDFLF